MALIKQDCETRFATQFNLQQSGMGATRANIMRLLRSLDLVGWSSHEESGRLDRKAFTRFSTGSTNIFAKRQYVEAEKSAVSIMIDCSGSMGADNKIGVAESVCIQLARILDKANVAFNVTGFYGGATYNRANESGANKQIEARTEIATLIPFKLWNENLAKASAKMGSISQWANGSTPDYAGVSLAIEDISKRPENRKILFLLTDADGYCKPHMRQLQKVADKIGIKLIAIGIGDTQVDQCFTNSQNVVNVNDLASASFNKLLKQLQ
jgi:cobalamin biosynthesis protein CobT